MIFARHPLSFQELLTSSLTRLELLISYCIANFFQFFVTPSHIGSQFSQSLFYTAPAGLHTLFPFVNYRDSQHSSATSEQPSLLLHFSYTTRAVLYFAIYPSTNYI